MLIKTLTVGHLDTNCYVVTDENTLDCAVIDPGAESNTILGYLEDNSLVCRAILLTHAHFDHVGALAKVAEATGARIYMGEGDVGLSVGGRERGFVPLPGTYFLREGDAVTVSGLSFAVYETPGHTPGGLSFVCEDALFTGDTLFRGSCGRTDFDGGDMKEELRSLRKLANLPGDYDVFPGHDLCTTLNRERAMNPYMARAVEGFDG